MNIHRVDSVFEKLALCTSLFHIFRVDLYSRHDLAPILL